MFQMHNWSLQGVSEPFFKILDRLPVTGRWYGPLVLRRKDIREKFKYTMNMNGSVYIRRILLLIYIFLSTKLFTIDKFSV
jgi:hypothetical protein